MKNMVCVDFLTKSINVDTDVLFFDSLSIDLIKNDLPEDLKDEQIDFINWWANEQSQTGFSLHENGKAIPFENTEENYNKYVKPYVDIWQARKDEIEQEQQEQEAEYQKFENRQARALTQLNSDFETVKERAYIKSSLGFTADANQTANENVTGLLVTIGDGTCEFCDYYNQFHTLNKAQLQTLQTEIIANTQNLYQQKWVYRTQIEGCSDNEQLDEVTAGIEFIYMDFTPTDEQA